MGRSPISAWEELDSPSPCERAARGGWRPGGGALVCTQRTLGQQGGARTLGPACSFLDLSCDWGGDPGGPQSERSRGQRFSRESPHPANRKQTEGFRVVESRGAPPAAPQSTVQEPSRCPSFHRVSAGTHLGPIRRHKAVCALYAHVCVLLSLMDLGLANQYPGPNPAHTAYFCPVLEQCFFTLDIDTHHKDHIWPVKFYSHYLALREGLLFPSCLPVLLDWFQWPHLIASRCNQSSVVTSKRMAFQSMRGI